MPATVETTEVAFNRLLDRHTGDLRESEVERLAEQMHLAPRQIEEVRVRLAESGVPVEDDCGRSATSRRYASDELNRHVLDALEQFLWEATRHRVLTGSEECVLAQLIEDGDPSAREQLITHNIRLVVSVARRYQHGGELTLLDLLQEGTIGLIAAADKFDWRKGFRFSTYATRWIRQSVGRAQASHARPIGDERVLSLAPDTVRRAVDALPTPDRDVLRLRFGIDDRPPQTRVAVARRLEMKAEDVCVAEQRALATLARVRELTARR